MKLKHVTDKIPFSPLNIKNVLKTKDILQSKYHMNPRKCPKYGVPEIPEDETQALKKHFKGESGI